MINPWRMRAEQGVAMLVRAGSSQRAARSLVQRWRTRHGDGRLSEAVAQAIRDGPVEPIGWIEAWLARDGPHAPPARAGPVPADADAMAERIKARLRERYGS